ncbi:hypothetical protein PWY87_10600 [Kribbella solani]|uniref:hypothetical protein n=1 Tax=Kribbella solani TaxID=236067 RepID=UPI0029B71772|nr:hypothetical protein [Kribbella solani]MDX3002121.1 hypothetical protein [Kribbella solani]
MRSFSEGTQSVKVHPTEVDCCYQIVMTRDGSKLLHLTTFGSDERQSKPKSSQSIQLDEVSARELIRVIQATFDLDRPV